MAERRGSNIGLRGGGNPDGKGLPGRPRRRWEDNIKMDLQEVGWEGMVWIDLAEGRVGGGLLAVIKLRVP
jgi:hypothetical protein